MLCMSHQHLVGWSTCQLCCCVFDALALQHHAGVTADQNPVSRPRCGQTSVLQVADARKRGDIGEAKRKGDARMNMAQIEADVMKAANLRCSKHFYQIYTSQTP